MRNEYLLTIQEDEDDDEEEEGEGENLYTSFVLKYYNSIVLIMSAVVLFSFFFSNIFISAFLVQRLLGFSINHTGRDA